MRKISFLALVTLILLSFVAIIPLSVSAMGSPHLMIFELSAKESSGRVTLYVIPPEDNSADNPDYALLPFSWYTTAKYWINPSNQYRFSTSAVVAALTASADAWDAATNAQVFSYQGTTKRSAGRFDGYNIVAWGAYRSSGVIAVTYIWYSSDRIIESDTIMNTRFKWSLSGEPRKMDVQNIMTHEFGHWCGLNDLYNNKDYWLTMYGYANYGETYKQTLGLGDISGLQAVYNP